MSRRASYCWLCYEEVGRGLPDAGRAPTGSIRLEVGHERLMVGVR